MFYFMVSLEVYRRDSEFIVLEIYDFVIEVFFLLEMLME